MKNKERYIRNEKENWLKVKCLNEYNQINVFGRNRNIPNLEEITLKNAYTKMRPISSKKKKFIEVEQKGTDFRRLSSIIL